jgi:hypothetical protein
MVQTCSKCSRANPADAVYCYFDGLVLGGHSRNGGPVAVGSQVFASSFVFPTGKTCRSFNELALACQDDWKTARDLLKQGYLENFLGGLGRIDLVMAAKDAAKFPDGDRGLDQFLTQIPSDVLDPPKLALETQEINLGILPVGTEGRQFDLRMENQGMRLLYGSVTCTDGLWLSFGDAPGAGAKRFQFGHDFVLPVHVVGDRLRAGNKPLEAHLAVECNGGTATVLVRATVPVKPFSGGALDGAKSPRQIAEKAKAHPKEAALQFENGEVSAWYKSNGWTYPVQGPPASGVAGVQQFFEALGLTPAPKVEISVKSVALSANPGDPLRYVLEVKTEEKKPIYAHGKSNQSWLEVGRGKANGRSVAIPLSIPSAPNKPGQTLTAKVTIHSNGNQRFVVPLTLQISGTSAGAFDFTDEPAPAPATVEPEVVEVVAAKMPSSAPAVSARPASSRQIKTAPSAPAGRRSPRGQSASKPLWMHILPAALLGLALLFVVGGDLFFPHGGAVNGHSGLVGDGNPDNWTYGNLADPKPKLALGFNSQRRFGLSMVGVPDPRNQDKLKLLTAYADGKSNNTIVRIDGADYRFGNPTPNNRWLPGYDSVPLPNNRVGRTSIMDFTGEKVRVKQHVEIVPGQSGVLDTCLVWYQVSNYGDASHTVGLRFMLDTYIGANDGVPFTAPGVTGFIDEKKEFKGDEIPPYLEAVENPDNPDDPGTVARIGLKDLRLPGVALEDLDDVKVCRYPGSSEQLWDVQMKSIKIDPPDSAVFLYWAEKDMQPKDIRNMAFTYGLSQLDVGGGGNAALALSTPGSVSPNTDFVVTAYVYNAAKGDEVQLILHDGLTLVAGEKAKKVVEEGGKRAAVYWHVHAGAAGVYKIEAASGASQTRPHDVVVKSSSIFG